MPLCPICEETTWDDSFLLFHYTDLVCEECVLKIRRATYFTINARFEISERRVADRYRIAPLQVTIEGPKGSLEVTARVAVERERSFAPLTTLEQVGFEPDPGPLPPGFYIDFPVHLRFEDERIKFSFFGFDGSEVILGWDFVLATLFPHLHTGLPDWRRAEQNDVVAIGPVLTILGGVSQTYAELRDLRSHGVIILGQDTSEIGRLRTIQKHLYAQHYDGLLVKDLPDYPDQSVAEKVALLSCMCRFAICDISIPSGHIDELTTLRFNRCVTAVLRQSKRGATWMQADYPLDFTFMKEFVYEQSPVEVVDLACRWAEDLVADKTTKLGQLYPWRDKN